VAFLEYPSRQYTFRQATPKYRASQSIITIVLGLLARNFDYFNIDKIIHTPNNLLKRYTLKYATNI